jgi:deoxyribodipyrimidine photo-lyase
MNRAIIWFRRDLRLQDNPTLQWAALHGMEVIALYIHAESEDGIWKRGAASRWWLHHSLQSLQRDLRQNNIELHLFKGDSLDVLKQLITDTSATTLLMNRLWEPHLHQRDQQLKGDLEKNGISVNILDEECLHNPETLKNKQGGVYRVFTPFYRQLRSQLESQPVELAQDKTLPVAIALPVKNSVEIDALGLLDEHPWHEKLHQHWQPGESSAQQQLNHFIENSLTHYTRHRDYPADDSTSRLSPHLHFGEITARQITQTLSHQILIEPQQANAAEAFLRQLIWREYARYVLWHYPHTDMQAMDERFTNEFWVMDEVMFEHWKKGESGFALIDAGMQQLWDSGFMHNRIRMLVASFLTKNLGLPWQAGARWFWETLVDADLANNSMGWQWVAGCGVDASPYYRIFNPQTQAAKFDPDSRYIDRWLSPNKKVERAMVDLKMSRDDALTRYKLQIRNR